MKTKIATGVITLITVIGRVGLVFLGIKAALTGLGFTGAATFVMDAFLIVAAFISYSAIFGRQIFRLFTVAADYVYTLCHKDSADADIDDAETPQPEQELTQLEEIKPNIGHTVARVVGWGAGIVTASVECIATFDGWGAFLTAAHVPEFVTLPIAIVMGCGSIVGWIALSGFPTATVISGLYNAVTCHEETPASSQPENSPAPVYKIVGTVISVLTGIGAGGVAFYAIVTALEKTRYATSLLPAYILTPFVIVASSCLYMTRLPTELKKLAHLLEHYEALDCNFPTIAKEALGTSVTLLTGTATYLLADTSVSTACKRLGIHGLSQEVIAGIASTCMAGVSCMVAGKEGYSLVTSPFNFFQSAVAQPARGQLLVINEQDDDTQNDQGLRDADTERLRSTLDSTRYQSYGTSV